MLLLLLLLSHSVMSDSVQPHRQQPARLPVPGILQARTLDWVAISFSKAWKWKVKVKSLSCVWLFVTPWTTAYQAPLSMGFSRQEYWSGLPFPSPRDLPDPEIEPRSSALQADALPSEPPGKGQFIKRDLLIWLDLFLSVKITNTQNSNLLMEG